MKLAFRDIEPFLKKPPANIVAVLVYGPDEGLVRERMAQLGKTVVADLNDPFNTVELKTETLIDDQARLMDEAQAQSLMGGRRLVRIREAKDALSAVLKPFLKDPPSQSNLVLVEAGELGPRSGLRVLFEQSPNAAAVPCYVDDARSLSKMIADTLREKGFSIAPDALSLMADNLLGDRAQARNEAEKLSLYMVSADKKTIAAEDILASMSGGSAYSFEDVARAAASGLIDEADKALQTLLAEGVPPVTILRSVSNYFYRLHLTRCRMDAGEGMESAIKKLQPPIFFKLQPFFEAQLRAWTQENIFQALHLLRQAEAQCKQTGAPDQLLCGRAMLALCQMAKRTGSSRRVA